MNIKNLIKLNFIILTGLLLFGCSSNKSVVGGYLGLDTDIKIEFVVDADSNPDELGVGSPLFVRMYELKSSKMMQRADFIDLYEQDKKILGADMVGDIRKLKRLAPGENRTEQFVLDEKTQFIAIYAEFLDFKGSKFKLVIPVVTNNVFRNSAVIRITGNQMFLNDASN